MKYLIFSFSFILFSCASHPVIPKASDIKVTREEPGKNCEDLGSITGRSSKINDTTENVLEDLKQEAVSKGANFVKIETMGAQGTAIRGEAYFCK
ncbi:MAG: DUF4156 domain-containing protein [Pseudobdellovibrio sp.]